MSIIMDDDLVKMIGIEKSSEIHEKASMILPASIALPVVDGVTYHAAAILAEIDGVRVTLAIPITPAGGKS